MSTDQAHLLWKSQLPRLDRIIAKCVMQVSKQLSRFHPAQFQNRIDQFKDFLQKYDDKDKNEITLEYMDVIADFIQGKKNKSLIQLANQLKTQFGGDLRYWLNTVQTVGQKINYADQIQVWQIRKPFQERLFMDAEDLSNFRQFTKITKKYMGSIKNLTKLIRRFDLKKDSINKIDEMYKKLKNAQVKYITFGEQVRLFQKSQTLDELSNNISQMNKNNAKKKLFHYQKQTKKIQAPKQKTLLQFMKIEKPILQRVYAPKSNIFITQKMLKGEKLKQFEDHLKEIKSKSDFLDFNQLRKDFIMSKLTKNYKSEEQQQQINYTSIYDKDYFYSYVYYPIQINQNISYIKPYQTYNFIDYQVQSEQQFQELLGDDIDKESQVSQSSSLTTNSFLVSDGHFSDQEEVQKPNKGVKFNIQTFFGQPWSFSIHSQSKSKKHKKINYQMIPLVKMYDGIIPMISQEEIYQEKILSQIVPGKDKKSIMQEIQKKGINITKAKVEEYLKKNCVLVKSDNVKSRASGKSTYKFINDTTQESNQRREIKQKQISVMTDHHDDCQSQEQEYISQKYPTLSNPVQLVANLEINKRITRQVFKNVNSQ